MASGGRRLPHLSSENMTQDEKLLFYTLSSAHLYKYCNCFFIALQQPKVIIHQKVIDTIKQFRYNKPPFQNAAKLLEIPKNVNRTRLTRHFFLALNLCLQQLYSSCQNPVVSSGLITIVVMTLLTKPATVGRKGNW